MTSPPPPIAPTLRRWVAADRRRRRVEGLVRTIGGTATILALTRLAMDWGPAWLGLGGPLALGALGWAVVRDLRRSYRSVDETAREVDQLGHTRELLRTALSIEAGSTTGDPALFHPIVAQAAGRLPELAPLAERPTRIPRDGVAGVLLGVALLVLPAPASDAPPSVPSWTRLSEASAEPLPDEGRPMPAAATPSDQPVEAAGMSSLESARAGTGDRSSQGGAQNSEAPGSAGSQGGKAASGDADGGASQDATGTGAGSSGGQAREAGTAGADDRGPTSQDAATSPRRSGEATTAVAKEEGNGQDASPDGRSMQSAVDRVAAETDAVRSDDETLAHMGDTPDDHDAQTRDVAGTLELSTDGPRFFDEDEQSDGEQNGKGGAGGWTVGLSQPGRGGVNDASGSTWRTEAGIPDPPDWTDTPAEWVDAAWQDSPAGVIRRVQGGEAGGRGSAAYQEAWHRYAAVAEADASGDEIPDGRRELVRAYFLAIAPQESP